MQSMQRRSHTTAAAQTGCVPTMLRCSSMCSCVCCVQQQHRKHGRGSPKVMRSPACQMHSSRGLLAWAMAWSGAAQCQNVLHSVFLAGRYNLTGAHQGAWRAQCQIALAADDCRSCSGFLSETGAHIGRPGACSTRCRRAHGQSLSDERVRKDRRAHGQARGVERSIPPGAWPKSRKAGGPSCSAMAASVRTSSLHTGVRSVEGASHQQAGLLQNALELSTRCQHGVSKRRHG